MKNTHFGIALLAGTSLIWGLSLVAQSMGMDHVGPFTFNAVRFFIGGISLLPLFPLINYLQGRSKKAEQEKALPLLRDKLLLKAGFWCGLVLFAAISCQQVGIIYTTAGKTGFITSLYILLVPLFGLLFGRRISWRIWMCIGLAIAGMYLLCIKEALTLNKGDVFVLVCAVFSAAQILVIDRYAPLVNAVKLASLQFFVCSGLSAMVAVILEKPDIGAVLQGWMPLLYTGVFSSSVAYSMQIAGQKYVAPVLAALLLSLEAVFGALAGWWILDEFLTRSERIGCLLIFVAILAAQLPGRMSLPRARRKP